MTRRHENYFAEIYARQQTGERFRPANEIVETVPTLTDAIDNMQFVTAFGIDKPREATVRAVKRSKYRNVTTGRYASKREAKRAAELATLAKAGHIVDLVEQPKFLLIPKQDGERACFYLGDFSYTTRDGKKVIEDVKSDPSKTPAYRIKRKLMLFVHGIKVTEVR